MDAVLYVLGVGAVIYCIWDSGRPNNVERDFDTLVRLHEAMHRAIFALDFQAYQQKQKHFRKVLFAYRERWSFDEPAKQFLQSRIDAYDFSVFGLEEDARHHCRTPDDLDNLRNALVEIQQAKKSKMHKRVEARRAQQATS